MICPNVYQTAASGTVVQIYRIAHYPNSITFDNLGTILGLGKKLPVDIQFIHQKFDDRKVKLSEILGSNADKAQRD